MGRRKHKHFLVTLNLILYIYYLNAWYKNLLSGSRFYIEYYKNGRPLNRAVTKSYNTINYTAIIMRNKTNRRNITMRYTWSFNLNYSSRSKYLYNETLYFHSILITTMYSLHAKSHNNSTRNGRKTSIKFQFSLRKVQ